MFRAFQVFPNRAAQCRKSVRNSIELLAHAEGTGKLHVTMEELASFECDSAALAGKCLAQ
jgi:hypothetical protein